MTKNNVLSRAWDYLFGWKRSAKVHTATEENLVLNIDFSLSEWIDPKTKHAWAAVTLLKAPYSGVKIKYNKLTVRALDENVGELVLSMNYDFIDTAGRAEKTLEDDSNFNNLLLNVAYAMLVSSNKNDDDDDEKEGIDEHLTRENLLEPRRDDIGEPYLK